MRMIVECPFCEGQGILHSNVKELTYRKELFKVKEHFYVCNICKQDFTTTEVDTVTISQLHNQYREKYSIPFLEEIISIREKYNVSAAKMSEILGLGVNGYSNYEKGEMPTPAIGNLIKMIDEPAVFRIMLEKVKNVFSSNMYANIINTVEYLIEQNKSEGYFSNNLNKYIEPSKFNGYKKTNKSKIASLLAFFITKCNSNFNDKLKLNKLMFYSDFLSYKYTGLSITGLSYRAIDYGPVPMYYDNIFTHFENEEIISSKWANINGFGKETFLSNYSFDKNIFTQQEIDVIELIIERFKDTSSWDIVELSHKEDCWIDLNGNREIIDYQKYAFELKGINF